MNWKSRYASWLVCPRESCTEPERIESREAITGGTRYHCACECGGRWAVVVLGERTTFAVAEKS